MRGVPDHGPQLPAPPHDVLGNAIRLHDRIAYCRCHEGCFVLAYVVSLDPLAVFEPDFNRTIYIYDSRRIAVLDYTPAEREVRNALRGVGLEQR